MYITFSVIISFNDSIREIIHNIYSLDKRLLKLALNTKKSNNQLIKVVGLVYGSQMTF